MGVCVHAYTSMIFLALVISKYLSASVNKMLILYERARYCVAADIA